jgi:hypothetical protein
VTELIYVHGFRTPNSDEVIGTPKKMSEVAAYLYFTKMYKGKRHLNKVLLIWMTENTMKLLNHIFKQCPLI